MKKSKGFLIMAGVFFLIGFLINIYAYGGVWISLIIALIFLIKEKREEKQNDATATAKSRTTQ